MDEDAFWAAYFRSPYFKRIREWRDTVMQRDSATHGSGASAKLERERRAEKSTAAMLATVSRRGTRKKEDEKDSASRKRARLGGDASRAKRQRRDRGDAVRASPV